MYNERSLDNLITPEELNARLTPEERKKNASKAGQASGEKRSLKALTRKWAEAGGYEKMLEVADENLGNPRFWEMLASLLGEPPTTRIEAEIEDRTLNVIINDGSED